jgi:hypothetical protein
LAFLGSWAVDLDEYDAGQLPRRGAGPEVLAPSSRRRLNYEDAEWVPGGIGVHAQRLFGVVAAVV